MDIFMWGVNMLHIAIFVYIYGIYTYGVYISLSLSLYLSLFFLDFTIWGG